MQSFVNRQAGQGSQASQGVYQGQPRNQLDAADLKVGVPSINRSNISHARNVTSMQPLVTKARGKAATAGPLRDTFAPTEYEGSTISTISRIQVRDSQVDDRGRPFAGYDERYHPNGPPGIEFAEHDGEESGSGDEYEEGEETDDSAEEQNLSQQQHDHYHQGQAVVDQQLLKRNPFDGGDSYPPTTTGGPDDDDEEEEEEGKSSQVEEPIHPAPPRQRTPLYQQPNRHLEAPVQRPVSRHQQHAPTQQEQASRHFPGGLQRQPVGLPLRQSPPIAKPVSQQNTHLNPAAVLEKARPNSASQPAQLGPKLTVKTRPIYTGSAKVNATGRAPAGAPQILLEPDQSVEDGTELDYDSEALKGMDYEELRTQEYDINPSNPPSVLPEDAPEALPGRLSLVQKMSTNNQRAFFSSLPLVEWEEAGDWFLSQFSEVVKKMTEARKEKRQMAIKLEGEISKRHEHVASRKRGIDEALSEMGKSGRDVLKGSTPKRQKGSGNAN
jgi:hypothetical protein